ncbi:hypothetical protein AAFN60_04570 [Roseibacillus persicicus]|uniref:hypothetical protein n=1 Tax=Roseibacillus persicicus TaxID=454148 RepID=UPI00398AAAE7
MTRMFLGVCAALSSAVLVSADVGESDSYHISIWVPGMEEPQEFSSAGEPLKIVLEEKCWAYVIKGIAGSITLGEQSEEGDFYSFGQEQEGRWDGQSSWASFGLGVNGSPLLEPDLFFSVTGDAPGDKSDFTIASLEDWYVLQADSDGQLAISFSPLVNDALFPEGEGVANVNPTIQLTLLADFYRDPPETSGDLRTSGLLSSRSGRVTLSWDFTRGEEVPSSRRLDLASL